MARPNLLGGDSISKLALEGLMQGYSDELGDMRVSSLNPALVRTRVRAKAFPAQEPATLITPEEVAKAGLWLLDAREIRGKALGVRIA